MILHSMNCILYRVIKYVCTGENWLNSHVSIVHVYPGAPYWHRDCENSALHWFFFYFFLLFWCLLEHWEQRRCTQNPSVSGYKNAVIPNAFLFPLATIYHQEQAIYTVLVGILLLCWVILSGLYIAILKDMLPEMLKIELALWHHLKNLAISLT